MKFVARPRMYFDCVKRAIRSLRRWSLFAAFICVLFGSQVEAAPISVGIHAGIGGPWLKDLQGNALQSGNTIRVGWIDGDLAKMEWDPTSISKVFHEFGRTTVRTIFGESGRFAAQLTGDSDGFSKKNLVIWVTLNESNGSDIASVERHVLIGSSSKSWVFPDGAGLPPSNSGLIALSEADEFIAFQKNNKQVESQVWVPVSNSDNKPATIAEAGEFATVYGTGNSPITASFFKNGIFQPLGRPINLSMRGPAGVGSNTLISGFVIDGKGSKTVLLRAAGPSLEQFGVNFLNDPKLTVYNTAGEVVAANEDWDEALAATFAQVGAFPWKTGSKDSAILVSLPAGAYTALVGNGDSANVKEALIEVYDVSKDADNLLVNVSCRASENPNTPLIAGVVLDYPAKLLIRNGGPSLEQLNVSGFASDTALTIFDSQGAAIGANDDWDTALSPVFASLGAYGYGTSIKDSAIELPKGQTTITAQAKSIGDSGVALVEAYVER